MKRHLLLTGLLVAVLALCRSASGADAGPVDYLQSVKPVLAARCYACHGGLQQKAGLRLDTTTLIRKGSDNGPVIVPGKSGQSALLERVGGTGRGRMPPQSEGEPLKEAEVALLRAWIDQGASGPADEKPEANPKDHWAFKPPVRPAVPAVRNPAWVRNPIDAFVAANHDRHGLRPQPAAPRPVLLRRVYLDLVGLPPTRDELAAFLADDSPDAYEKVVERLLASKQYAERWGRHWMDVWRYSDWWGLGPEVRNSQKHIWHWRDWILESLADDKGYDQMVREMLAADELYPDDPGRLRATGYLARSYFKFNRNSWLDEVVEHTSKAFLGLTFNCARCHDHKYDPIAQKDYYRLRAFFEPYQVRTDMTPGEADFEKDGVPRAFDCNLDAPTYLFVRGDEKQPLKTRPIEPGLPALLAPARFEVRPVTLPPVAHSPGLRPFVLETHLKAAQRQIAAAGDTLAQARRTLAAVEKKGTPPAAPAATTPLVKDDFARARPEVWDTRSGKWTYESGKLVQHQDGPERRLMRLRQQPPVDFEARLKVTVLGGQTYKSVGLSFDAAGDDDVLVYLSAFGGGPKLQIAYKQGGNYVYPPGAMQPRAVKENEPQELTVRVRGSLVNVAVGGKQALAYRLPLPRRPGHVELIAFDARAAFTGFELSVLPADTKLVEAGKPSEKDLTPEQARLAVAVAEKALAAAEAMPVALKARAAADRARLGQPPAADAVPLAREAARAERQAAVAAAEEAVARAEQAGDAAKLAGARNALTKARKEAEKPGETYTPLRGSLKSVESNLEGETSRNKPFPTTSSGRRRALAAWMTESGHPLTSRVAVNHIWARHLGRPLAATVFDLGRKGAAPAHPELLDWLAVEFVQHGWSMKHLHRLIVTSNTYRMTSSSAGAGAADPENRYYWRMNPVRMEAQVVRDSLLYLSGELDLTTGGPSVPASDESSRRRSLYFVHSHNEHNAFLSIFDDANVLECYRRAESVVPQQALALENSKLALAAAEKVARRLSGPGPVADAVFIRAAFETVLGGPPTAGEQAECARALAELKDLAVREKRPDALLRARANLVHALINHNDFVTVR